MEHYKKVYLNPDDHRRMDITAFIVGIILKVLVLPIFYGLDYISGRMMAHLVKKLNIANK